MNTDTKIKEIVLDKMGQRYEILDYSLAFYIEAHDCDYLLKHSVFNGPLPNDRCYLQFGPLPWGRFYRFTDKELYNEAIRCAKANNIHITLKEGYDVMVTYSNGFKSLTETRFVPMAYLQDPS